MEIKIHKEMRVSEQQQEYVERKVGRLKKLAGRFWNPAAFVHVELKENSVADRDRSVHCAIKMPLPGETLYATTDAKTVEACIDLVENKLVQQLDKYKGKHS